MKQLYLTFGLLPETPAFPRHKICRIAFLLHHDYTEGARDRMMALDMHSSNGYDNTLSSPPIKYMRLSISIIKHSLMSIVFIELFHI